LTAADIAARWFQGEPTPIREQMAKGLAQRCHVAWADVLAYRGPADAQRFGPRPVEPPAPVAKRPYKRRVKVAG
jgi:hypothetical protein